jgi:hypothetical protein
MFQNIVQYISSDKNLKIVDIWWNDGTLLSAFKEESKNEMQLLNIDPSVNLTEICESKWIPTIVWFFSKELANEITEKYDVVTSTNVFQHLKNIKSFAQWVHNILSDNWIRVLEFPYWINSMETNQFDQVYHEHMYYHSVTPLQLLMDLCGLKIINITKQDIHWGSLRLIMSKKNSSFEADNTISQYHESEKKYTLNYYKDRWSNVQAHIKESREVIKEIKKNGHTIYGFGAAAKWCIYLNAMEIDYNDIDYVIDDTNIKQNKFIPWTWIEIVSREILKYNKPDYILILAHNFSEYIIKSLEW